MSTRRAAVAYAFRLTRREVIRKFYGIPAPEETKQRALGLAINLADFL
ncbi:MAG: hypothetical protein ACLTEZ_15345 [Ruthenibacterium lactatiformans]